ncbi:putative multidrug resistance protein [Yarrowia sp. B02]|nr:putative multidrug resistance protein [Yarrowia sp. B02]
MFSEAPPLPQGVGYGILVGVGALFAVFVVFTLRLSASYLGEKANKSEMFMVANRTIGVGLTGSAVFSSWMWAAETLFSSVMGYTYGIAGPYWFAAGLTFQIALMAVLGIQVKLKVPNGHTLLEIMKYRYGVPGHVIYMVLCLVNNIISCSTMILATAGAITAITGMHSAAASMLIPLGVILYTAAGGLKATFLTDYIHTTIALVLLIYFCVGIIGNEHIGGVYGLYDKVTEYSANAEHYVKGNYLGSLLSFKSQGAVIFSICHNIGNLGLVIMDTAFWQKSMAADLKATVQGYMIGSVLIFAVPWALGTICGLGARVLEDAEVIAPVSLKALEVGNVFPLVARAMLGKGASVGIVLMLFMSCTSTVSAEMIAVSSIISFDIFRTYIKPDASDRLIILVSHIGVVSFGLLSGAIALAFYYGGISLSWMTYFVGIVITPGVFPVLLTVLWKRQSRLAALAAPVLGLLSGIGVWLGTTYVYYGKINVVTTGMPLPNVWGNITTMFSSLLYSVVITLIRPEDFDWLVFQNIKLVNEESASDEESVEFLNESKVVDDSKTVDAGSSSEVKADKTTNTTIQVGSVIETRVSQSNSLFQPRLVIPEGLGRWKTFLYYIGWDTEETDYRGHPLGEEAVPVMIYWYKVAQIFAIVICLVTWIMKDNSRTRYSESIEMKSVCDSDTPPAYSEVEKAESCSIFKFTEKGDYPYIAIGMVSCALEAGVGPLQTVLMGKIFDVLAQQMSGTLKGKFMTEIGRYCGMSLGLVLLGFLTDFFSNIAFIHYGDRQLLRLSRKIKETFVKHKSMAWYDHNQGVQGSLNVAFRNIEDIQAACCSAIAFAIKDVLTIAISMGVAMYHSWSLTLVIMAGLPIIVLVALGVAPRLQRHFRDYKEVITDSSVMIDWSMSGLQHVKLSNGEKKQMSILDYQLALATKAYMKFTTWSAAQQAFMQVLGLVMFVQGFWFGANQVQNGKLSAGAVMTCFFSAMTVTSHIASITGQMMSIMKAMVSAGLVHQLINSAKPSRKDIRHYPKECYGNIVVHGVTFAYPTRPDVPVLKDVCLEFQQGRTTFVVGQSGSGKSTISNLLLQVYDGYDGEIRVDGFEARGVSQRWLYENINVVRQTTALFETSIRENIQLGRGPEWASVTEDDIDEACQFALLSSTICDLPLGLETKTTNLSGGQRQRVALARAYVRNTPILIMDESLSALDIVFRELMVEAIRKWRKNKTTIVVTHELSQIRADDVVYLMRDGQVVQSGLRKDIENYGYFKELRDQGQTKEAEKEAPPVCEIDDYENNVLRNTYIPMTSTRRVRKWVTEKATEGDVLDRKRIPVGYVEFSKLVLKTVPNKPLFYAGLALSLLLGAANPAFGWTISQVISQIMPNGENDSTLNATLVKWSLIVIGIALLQGLLAFFHTWTLEKAANQWTVFLRKSCFSTVVTREMGWFARAADSTHDTSDIGPFHFDRNAAGITELIINETEELRSAVGTFFTAIISICTICVVGFIWSLVQGWKLTLVSFSIFPGFLLTSQVYAYVSSVWEMGLRERIVRVQSLIHECVTGVSEVRILNLDLYFEQKYAVLEKAVWKYAKTRGLLVSITYASHQVFTPLLQVIILWVGMKFISTGEYTMEKLMGVMVILIQAMTTAAGALETIPQMSKGMNVTKTLFALMDEGKEDTSEDGGTECPDLHGEINFRGVDFAYQSRKEAPVLTNFSMKIASQETVVIVGPSGSGKSTVTNLLTKLYPYRRGSVSIGKHDIRKIDTVYLRQRVAVVTQSPAFFCGSITQNLTYGCAADPGEIERVCKLVGIHDFVMSLADGYRTVIGNETGSGTALLSGGQSQRLSIARALLRNPQILILDECTSALDNASAKVVHELILKLKSMRKITMIVVTHSHELMKLGDRVLVLGSRGEGVVEQGPYEQLMSHRGPLYSLVNGGVAQ